MTMAVALAEPVIPDTDEVPTHGFGRHTLELHEACAELLPGYGAARSETERVSLLTRACLRSGSPLEGARGIERWVVHDVQRPSDVLCALWLAHYSGLFQPPRGAPSRRPRATSTVELVPQFERRAAVERDDGTLWGHYSNTA